MCEKEYFTEQAPQRFFRVSERGHSLRRGTSWRRADEAKLEGRAERLVPEPQQTA